MLIPRPYNSVKIISTSSGFGIAQKHMIFLQKPTTTKNHLLNLSIPGPQMLCDDRKFSEAAEDLFQLFLSLAVLESKD